MFFTDGGGHRTINNTQPVGKKQDKIEVLKMGVGMSKPRVLPSIKLKEGQLYEVDICPETIISLLNIQSSQRPTEYLECKPLHDLLAGSIGYEQVTMIVSVNADQCTVTHKNKTCVVLRKCVIPHAKQVREAQSREGLLKVVPFVPQPLAA